MPESFVLKPDWFKEIKLFSVRNEKISLYINPLSIFLEIGSNEAGWLFFKTDNTGFYFHSNGKQPV